MRITKEASAAIWPINGGLKRAWQNFITASYNNDCLRLGGVFDIDQKIALVAQKEEESHANNFWDNPQEAEKKLKQISELKSWTNSFAQTQALLDEFGLAIEFHNAGEMTEDEVDQIGTKALQAIEKMEFRRMMSGANMVLKVVTLILTLWQL